MTEDLLSTGDAARLTGVDAWRIRRLFEAGDIDEVSRLGSHRAIPSERLPEIKAALAKRGWLPQHAEEAVEA